MTHHAQKNETDEKRNLKTINLPIMEKGFSTKNIFFSPAGGAVHFLLSGWLSSGLQHQNSAELAGVKTS